MRRASITTGTALAISLLMLGACGQTGPLYPPDQEASARQDEQIEKAEKDEQDAPQEQSVPTTSTQDQ